MNEGNHGEDKEQAGPSTPIESDEARDAVTDVTNIVIPMEPRWDKTSTRQRKNNTIIEFDSTQNIEQTGKMSTKASLKADKRLSRNSEDHSICHISSEGSCSDTSASSIASSPAPKRSSAFSEPINDLSAAPVAFMRLPRCFHEEGLEDLLKTTSPVPPVTSATVQELDLKFMQNNVHLRVDVHHDHDLHFLPVSGARGEEKRVEALKYWKCLSVEFLARKHGMHPCCKCAALPISSESDFAFPERLTSLFSEMKELLYVLVPDRERQEVMAKFDIPLLVQEVNNNALDIIGLVNWVCALLLSHCAPVRDQLASEMAAQISQGAVTGDNGLLVAGLEKLFAFCEAMKLDVANHQLRTFKAPLIEDGIAFQRDYFSTRIEKGKLDISSARSWYANISRLRPEAPLHGVDVLIAGVVDFCVFGHLPVPRTFKYDGVRIRQRREELQDILHLRLCFKVFDECIYTLFGPGIQPSIMHMVLGTRLMDLTEGQSARDGASHDPWISQIVPCSVEIARAVTSAAQRGGRAMPSNLAEIINVALTKRMQQESCSSGIAFQISTELHDCISVHVREFSNLSALQISEAQRVYQENRKSQPWKRYIPDLEDISRRLAHTSVIHWRVWADLAYLPDTSIAEGVGFDTGLGTSSLGNADIRGRLLETTNTLYENM